jgi:4-hydroxy-tetrahydrodipicolinate synthase
MTQKSPLFAGVFTAIVTPFKKDHSLDLEAFKKLIDKQLADGIDGFVVCGSTGEGMTVSDDERATLVKTCLEQVKGRVPVIAGAGSSNTQTACRLQKQMKDLGASGTLQVTPWYNKPTPEGLYRHFSEIAKTCDLPIILYNVPSRTGCDMNAQTVLRLAKEHANIVGLKESNLEAVRLQTMLSDLKKCRPDFAVVSGEDGFVLPLLAMGGHGVISMTSNVAPKVMLGIVKAFNEGNLSEAQAQATRMASLTGTMFYRSNPMPVKTALHLMGAIENTFRLPLCPLSDEDMRTVQTQLTEQGWL